MGTQVITRDTGRRLGVVGEVVVDIDRREVVALGLRDNPLTRFLPGLPRWMPLDRIRQVGDVILVDSADSLVEAFNPERYSKVINCQVITEAGNVLGRVLGFSFDIETGELASLVIGALGVPLLGEGVLSTWELSVQELVSSGPDRIIVYEGADEKLKQLSSGLLEKLGIGGSSWEQEERDRFRSTMVPVENQLAAGQAATSEQRRIQPATSRAVVPEEQLEYVEVEERREREPLRQRLYLDEDEPEFRSEGREPRGVAGPRGQFDRQDLDRGERQDRERDQSGRDRFDLDRDDSYRRDTDRRDLDRRDLDRRDFDRQDFDRRDLDRVEPARSDLDRRDLGRREQDRSAPGRSDLDRRGLGSGDLGSGDLVSGDLGSGDLGGGDLGGDDLGGGDLYVRDRYGRDPGRLDAAAEDPGRRDAYDRDTSGRDAYERDAYERDLGRRETSVGDNFSRDLGGRDAYSRDAYGRDSDSRDLAGGDAYGRDRDPRDLGRRDFDLPNRESQLQNRWDQDPSELDRPAGRGLDPIKDRQLDRGERSPSQPSPAAGRALEARPAPRRHDSGPLDVEVEPLPQVGRQEPATRQDPAPLQRDDRDAGFEDPW
jgi:sporulation protein YlmC with PRC-barrel domain